MMLLILHFMVDLIKDFLFYNINLPTFLRGYSARLHVCMQHVSVGQQNPLRQVMWVSNPL